VGLTGGGKKVEIDEHFKDGDSEEDIPGALHESRIFAVDDDDHHLQDEDNRARDEKSVSVNIVQDGLVPASQPQYHR